MVTCKNWALGQLNFYLRGLFCVKVRFWFNSSFFEPAETLEN
jgi:hypothetical protein